MNEISKSLVVLYKTMYMVVLSVFTLSACLSNATQPINTSDGATIGTAMHPVASSTPIIYNTPTLSNTLITVPTLTVPLTPTRQHSDGQDTKTPSSSSTSQTMNVYKKDENVVFLYSYLDSGGYLFFNQNTSNIGPQETLSFPTSMLGPGGSPHLVFANHKEMMAYWDANTPRGLWISDLAYSNPYLVFTDTEEDYAHANITWTPDDFHIIVDSLDEDSPDLIYHVDTNELEIWQYKCERLTISPKSKLLSIWCDPEETTANYAIIEWGGEIWFTEREPENEIVNWKDIKLGPMGLYSILGWSSDGEKVAYFNTNDNEGSLYIASAHDIKQLILPNSAYWLSPIYQIIYPFDHPIEWSKNGEMLLFLAIGDETLPCPDSEIRTEPNDGVYQNDACWHVMDISTGEVIWNLSDLDIDSDKPSYSRDYYSATISDDGKLLSISSRNYFEKYMFIIDIETNTILWDNHHLTADSHRWGRLP
jgi:hypothetical protein